MNARLTLCSHCSRHVRTTDASCPFCDSALATPQADDVMRTTPLRWPSRAAVFAFGATIAAAGCGDDDTIARDTGPRADTGSIEAGTTPPPPPLDSGSPLDMSMPPADMGPVPLDMSMPPVDLGFEDVGIAPPYGVPDPPPPPEDAGVMPLYGAAPPTPGRD